MSVVVLSADHFLVGRTQPVVDGVTEFVRRLAAP